MEVNRSRLFILCLVLVAGISSAFSQTPQRRPVRNLGIDSSMVEPVQISEEAEEKIFSDKAYIYQEDEFKRGRNFVQEILDAFKHKAQNNSPTTQARRHSNGSSSSRHYSGGSSGTSWNGSGIGNIVLIILIIAIVAGLVALIATGKWKKVFTPKPLETPFDFKEITEDLEGLNIDKLIEQARLAGDFRLATRWWYLKLLKKFTVCNLIAWKPHKTNHDYFRELQNTTYIVPFKQASHVYEHVWYGEMPVSEDTYMRYTPEFAELEKNIHA